MQIPINDVRDVFNAGNDMMREREQDVRIAIFVGHLAPQYLTDTIRNAFFPIRGGGMLHVSPFGPNDQVVINSMTDIALVVSGGEVEAAQLYKRCRDHDIPTAVVGTDLVVMNNAIAASGTFVTSRDLISTPVMEDLLSSLAQWVIANLDSGLHLAAAANFPFLRSAKAQKIVDDTAKQNALIGGVTIIPGADMPVMTANQAKMILQIAAVYDEELGMERAKELLAVLGGGVALRTVARQAVTAFPGVGWAIKAGIGFSGTLAMGKAAIEYFESGGNFSGIASKARDIGGYLGEKASSVKSNVGKRGSDTKSKLFGRLKGDKKKKRADKGMPQRPVEAEEVYTVRVDDVKLLEDGIN